MNATTRIATLGLAAMLFGSNVQAAQFDYAKVRKVEPILNYVTVKTPVRECWEEMQYYTVDRNQAERRASTFLGAVIGGVVGHQIGSGRGNDAATVAGSLIGAAIANDAANDRYGHGRERVAYPVERCETRYRAHREERVDGYRVHYTYHGQRYVTEMPYDPGKRIRIRVDVRPVR
jgi:uncharacterized protein YcfJ